MSDSDLKVTDRRWWARGEKAEGSSAEAEPKLKPTYIEELEARLAAKDGASNFRSVNRCCSFGDIAPAAARPARSPLTSAMNVGTPIREKRSART